jgi:hypothetical protein
MKQPADIATSIFQDGIILNLEKVFLLDYNGQHVIMELWRTLLYSTSQFMTMNPVSKPLDVSADLVCSYNTLNEYGYLTTRREKNLDALV